MTNLILDNQWEKWYPKQIFLKNLQDNQNFLYNLHRFTENDFLFDVKNEPNDYKKKQRHKLTIDLKKKESSKIELKKELLKIKKENAFFKSKLDNLFIEYEKYITQLEDILCTQLLKIALKISSYVIGKNIHFDELVLQKYIKKIIDKEGIFLKKPQIIVHPCNKIFIKKIFKDWLNTYQWKLIYDENIDVNGLKIKSENGDIDATMSARWQELCRLIFSEDY